MIFDKEPSLLDKVIRSAEIELVGTPVDSDKYEIRLERLTKLYKLKNDKSSRVSPDTIVMAVTNIVGILMVIKAEHVGIITTRAINMISKTKM